MPSVFLLRDGDQFGPYTREDASQLLEQGLLAPNDLVKIGADGKPFPASFLRQPASREESASRCLIKASIGIPLTDADRSQLTPDELISVCSLANQKLSLEDRLRLASRHLVTFARLGNPLTPEEVARLSPADHAQYVMIGRESMRDGGLGLETRF